MNESEFKKKAVDFGYSEEEIAEFIELHKESGIPYDALILNEHIND